MNSYIIDVGETPINIKVTDFSPPVEGRTSGPPEQCYPAEPGSISWEADTGNEGLDNYLNNANDIAEEIAEQLFEAIEEGKTNAMHETAEAKADDFQDADFMEHYF